MDGLNRRLVPAMEAAETGSGARSTLPAGSKPATQRRRGQPDALQGPLVSDSFLRPTFTLEQIRTFLAVASREHVTHAARVLRLSQPAVTQQVQLLERALGVRLLERVGRSVRLTSAGVEVGGACLLIMRALENLENVVQAVRGLDLGSVSVGASHLAATYFLPPVLAKFVATHPRINVGVVVGDAEDVCRQVVTGQVECGLIEGSPTAPQTGLVRARVAATEVVIVSHPNHAVGLDPVDSEDLLQASRYLVWGPGSAVEEIAAQILGEQYECTTRLQIGSLEAARRSLLCGPGFVAAMPAVAVCDDLRSGALVRLRHNSVALPVFAIRRRGPESPALEALWQALIRKNGASPG